MGLFNRKNAGFSVLLYYYSSISWRAAKIFRKFHFGGTEKTIGSIFSVVLWFS